jgi:D-sedoheptulose 7-phosphate isomerase
MTKGGWAKRVEFLGDLLDRLSFRNEAGAVVGRDEGFRLWRDLARQVRENARTLFMIGNGASASMASHLAADLAKNAHVHTEVFSDLSLITAISNDMGYEHVFAEPLRRRGCPGDLLVAISSSGKSPNILLASEVARDRGLAVVTVSAMRASNPLRSMGHLNAHVPTETYGLAETCHAAILHYWMDLIGPPGS